MPCEVLIDAPSLVSVPARTLQVSSRPKIRSSAASWTAALVCAS